MSDNFLDMSPLQLKQLVFGRVHVEAVSSSRLPEDPFTARSVYGPLTLPTLRILPQTE